LREHHADVALLHSLLRAPQISLRLAAVEACRGCRDAELCSEIVKLAEDQDDKVREKLAEVLGSIHSNEAIQALRSLAQDSNETVRLAAVKSSSGRAEYLELQRALLDGDPIGMCASRRPARWASKKCDHRRRSNEGFGPRERHRRRATVRRNPGKNVSPLPSNWRPNISPSKLPNLRKRNGPSRNSAAALSGVEEMDWRAHDDFGRSASVGEVRD